MTTYTGGGVMLLVDRKFNKNEKLVNHDLVGSVGSIENIAVTLNNIIYMAVYISPLNKFEVGELDILLSMKPNIVMGGDFNVKHQAWENCSNNKFGRILSKNLSENFTRPHEVYARSNFHKDTHAHS